jgi:hypothetical protein
MNSLTILISKIKRIQDLNNKIILIDSRCLTDLLEDVAFKVNVVQADTWGSIM